MKLKKAIKAIGDYLEVEFSEEELSQIDHTEQRRIRQANFIGLINIANMLLYALAYSVIDFHLFKHGIIALSFFSILTIGIVIINKYGKYFLTKILLSVLIPIYIIYLVIIVYGNKPEFQVYLFLSTLIPLFLWGKEKYQYPIIIITVILITYIITEFFPPNIEPKITLPENYIHFFKTTNVAVCFFAAGIAIVFYQYHYKNMEEKLIKQSEELKLSQIHKDKVYSIIAHDLRGPFGLFTNLTEVFLRNYKSQSDERRLKIITSMHNTSASMHNLLENLLNWSKMQSGNLNKTISNIKLLKLVKESVALHNEIAKENDQKIIIDIDPDIEISADHHMISTVFRNLISNALKFTKEKGEVSISATLKQNKIHVCIKDTGMGLTKEEIDQLFDLKLSEKITEIGSNKGSGLGLLLCKDFIEIHQEKLWVESEKGAGSKFYFTLPKATK